MIEVKNLTKWYGDHLAVSDICFTIEPGQIYGFLGPNGAGKTTIMNIMTGCLAATEGKVMIEGYDIFEDSMEAKRLIGYLPEIPPLYIDQTPKEYLYFVASAKKIPREKREAEINKVIEETHIQGVSDRLIRQLSKGYRQRVGIAQALLGNPAVIILDEPTVGLDPAQIIEIRDLIRELGKNHTVILSSHILSEVETICEKVLIIYQGKLIAFDEPENLRKTLSGDVEIKMICEGSEDQIRSVLGEISGIREVRFALETGEDGKELPPPAEDTGTIVKAAQSRFTVISAPEDVTRISREMFFAFAREGLAILRMNPEKADLEEIFMELTSKEVEDESGI